MVTKEMMVWAIVALYLVMMVSQIMEYRMYPQSRVGTVIVMAFATVLMVAFLAAVPHV